MQSTISFIFNGKPQHINFNQSAVWTPTTTVLNYLRSLPEHKGTKEGCAEGDCGACTVVLAEMHDDRMVYRAVNSCLVFLPKLHKKWLITVENLKSPEGKLHPVQRAMVDFHGSQCGYCTPGFIMSLFALYKSDVPNTREMIEDALTGNLCRCTGYQPILEAAESILKHREADPFTALEKSVAEMLNSVPGGSVSLDTGKQKYFLPASLTELLDLRVNYPAAILINGATDIALKVTKQHKFLPEIIDTDQVEELKKVTEDRDRVVFGSAVNLNRVLTVTENYFPALAKMCNVFGSKQIREMATIGGNLATASPIGDLPPVLAAYDAEVCIKSNSGERFVPVDDFITGYRKTVLHPDEIITEVRIPKPGVEKIVRSYKVSKRKDLDISTVSACFCLELGVNDTINDIKIIYGGMAEMTRHATKAEEFLRGKKWTKETVAQGMAIIEQEFHPISDARSGAAFRTIAAKNLLLKFWAEISREEAQYAQKK